MTPDECHKIDDIFTQAVCVNRAQRSAFLQQACAGLSTDVRSEVEALLAADDYLESQHQSSFRTGPVNVLEWCDFEDDHVSADMGSTQSESPSGRNKRSRESEADPNVVHREPPSSGQQVSKFQLIERLGTGTYGTVWKAYDTVLDRNVALKIPRMDLIQGVEQRVFTREAQAASRFKHPNIVTVHEAVFENDRVLIASELIEGVTLAEWMQTNRLSVVQAAELCITLADALRHAHSHGVIHRDLKPSNIILDANCRPFITDFGLAKRDLCDATLSSEGNVLGTPAYMPPEQARGEGHLADARSDIYSLGVIFFELLTSERPFRGNVQRMMDLTINEDPPSPRTLVPGIPRDIETICLKCLEKSPDRRYQTADGLSADLGCWLRNEPISARPIGRLGRSVRLCRRYPVVASLVAAITVLTVVSFVVVTSLYLQADKNRIDAERHLKRRTVNFNKTIDAVELMLTRVIEHEQPGLEGVQNQLLYESLELYRGLIQPARDDATVLVENARLYMRIGNLYESLGRPEDSVPSYESAISHFEAARDQRPVNSSEELVESYRRLANSILSSPTQDGSHWQQAEMAIERAIEIAQADSARNAAERFESLARSRDLYSNLLKAQGQRAEAIQQLRKAHDAWMDAVKYDPSSQTLRLSSTWCKHRLADMLIQHEQFDEARQLHEEVLKLRLEQIEERDDGYLYHPSPIVRIPLPKSRFSLRNDLAATYRSLGRIDEAQSQFDEAEVNYQTARGLIERVVKDFPHRDSHRNALAGIHSRLGNLLAKLDRHQESFEHFELAITHRKMISNATTQERHLRSLADHHFNAGWLGETLNRPIVAVQHYRAAFDLYSDLREQCPKDGGVWYESIRLSLKVAELLEEIENTAAACDSYESALRISEEFRRRDPSNDSREMHDKAKRARARFLGLQ